ncbi:hypothetical protein CNMCM8927_003499 [Aspergillus lentulus]|uniref:Pisatin demethylase n=1 Tax=Aspergillus lentulus TaxID=293939 RepID=A0AAN6BK50_ASPLE|nr:hypothetical protein CNMCM8927_003499 [Aspergillus lentulus]
MWSTILYCAAGLIFVHFLRNALRPGLVTIPGPFMARFSGAWRLYMTWRREFKESLPGLHEKYQSSLIRIGPNIVSCSDPKAVEVIYGFHNEMKKSDLVKTMAPIYNGKRQVTMFSAADNKTHGRIRRPVAGAYAMTNVIQFEPFVNQNVKTFYSRIQELFIEEGKPCEIHDWVQYFAFDVILEMTMSHSLGFMKAGGDVDGILRALQKDLDYKGIVLSMPLLDRLWKLNPVSKFFKPRQSSQFATRCRRILDDRLSERDGTEDIRKDRPHDFTDRFLEAQRKDGSISDGQMIGYVQANLIAGSDTTATVMRTAIYYTLKNPWIHRKMVEELDSKQVTFPVPFKVARFELPFCGAVIREALRYHFPFIGLMERETPASGVELPDGRRLPGGVVIGMHADLIGRDKSIFGKDADSFNPLRWLQAPEESREEYETRLRAMNAHDISFGFGPRSCIGKHVAEMEIYKFIPTFFGLLEPQFVHPTEPWKVRQLFVFKQSGMDMYLRWRDGKSIHSLKA